MKLTSQKKAFLCLKLAGLMPNNAVYCLDISMVIYKVKQWKTELFEVFMGGTFYLKCLK